jgi:NAD(P)-dependent dehydrogenase (short-subunit alcohol dehydrogenase family)
MHNWTTADIPPQNGKLALVTGTGGLGYETALALARAGAEVILAGRNEAKGRDAIQKISAVSPSAKIRFEMLDLASLDSVARCGRLLVNEGRAIDILINNAAVMAPPKRQVTADGFELQFGTNYLGHFALTAELLPLLRNAQQARVINLSSLAHRQGVIQFDDLQAERVYNPWSAYCQSKLAMLMFAFELQRRSDANGWGLMSIAAHPGYARTDLISNGPGSAGMVWKFNRLIQPLISHSAAAGALPTLFAATSLEAKRAGYYGPNRFYELKGSPVPAYVAPKANDVTVAAKLWDISEQIVTA